MFNTILLAASETTGGLTIEAITQYLFWVATVAMGAGTVFFLVERQSVPERYRTVMTVAGLVTGIACFHYFRMGYQYAAGEFPTEYRYIDWIITTPLLLVKFPLLMALGKSEGRKLITQLVVLDVFMILTAYIAEVSAIGGVNWWSFFVLACLFELGIVAILYITAAKQIAATPKPIADAIKTMRLFILVGWAIYPIGFLMALTGETGGSLREIFYNVADVVNKVGFGLVAYSGIKALAASESQQGQPEPSAPANPATA